MRIRQSGAARYDSTQPFPRLMRDAAAGMSVRIKAVPQHGGVRLTTPATRPSRPYASAALVSLPTAVDIRTAMALLSCTPVNAWHCFERSNAYARVHSCMSMRMLELMLMRMLMLMITLRS